MGFRLCLLAAALAGVAPVVLAAPPAITHLNPAGGRRGTTVEFIAAGTLDASTKMWASGTGVAVEPAKGKGRFKVVIAKDAVPGAYWLRAHNAEGASALRPFIVGMLPEAIEKEPNDDFKKPQVLSGSQLTVNGCLVKPGDVDCFAVSLKKGQTLVASLEAHHTLRSPMDAMLQILSAEGFVLEENNDFHGLDPQLAFTATRDGTYIARVYAFPASPDASIRYFGSPACVYRLTLTTGAFADFAVPLALNKRSIADGVLVHGWNIPKSGKRLAITEPIPGATHITLFDAEVANPLRVSFDPDSTSNRVAVARDDRAAPQYEVPFTVTARLDKKGSVHRTRLNLKKGQAFSVQVESRALGLEVNPVIEVFDAAGKRLARAEPARLHADSELAFTPPADGEYTIAASDHFGGGGGPRDLFLLRVRTVKPDYDLTVAADRFSITPGKATSISVKVNRKNGFTRPVEIVAEGLPVGVKLETTKPAKPDPGLITLSLTAEKPAAGRFRLFGQVKDEPQLRRTVQFPMPEFDEQTADLWLTVLPRP